MADYSERPGLPPLQFGGYNTRIREAFYETDFATTIRNVDLRPSGCLAKRAGLSQLLDGSDRDEPAGTGAGEAIAGLTKQSDGASFMLAMRGGLPSYNDFAAGGFERIENEFTAGAIYKTTTAPFSEKDPYATEYLGECLYVANGEDEPHILTGESEASFTEQVNVASVTITIGTYAEVTLASTPTYDRQQGDWVAIAGVTGAAGAYVAAQPWRCEWTSATTFYLCEYDGSRHIPATTVATGTGGTADFAVRALMRWPTANWSATASEQRTGYPSRWDDPNQDSNNTWPRGDTTDFPAGVEYVGEGDSARMYAYGFDLDPDRIDYSQLGVPWHFGKASFEDVDGNDAADEDDAVAQPGIDGGFFYCNRGDGDRVVGIREYAGYLIVFKRRRIFIYSGVPGSSGFDSVGLVRVISSGAVSDNSIFYYGNELYYWSLDGPRSIGVTDAYGDLLHTSLAYDIQERIDDVTQESRNKIHGFWDRANERVMWFAPIDGSTDPECAFVYYPRLSENDAARWSYFDGRYAETPSVAVFNETLNSNEVVYQINDNGIVYSMNVSTIDDYTTSGYYSVAVESVTGGPFEVGETVRWDGGASSGELIVYRSGAGSTGFMSIDVTTGTAPDSGDNFLGDSSSAQATASDDSYLSYTEVPIEMEYISNWRPLGGTLETAKRGLYLTLVFGDGGRGAMTIQTGKDYEPSWQDVDDVVWARGIQGSYWGTAVWGSFTWGSTQESMIRYALTNVSRMRRFRFYDASKYTVDLIGFSADIRMKGDRGA